jgi:hypothetical protein
MAMGNTPTQFGEIDLWLNDLESVQMPCRDNEIKIWLRPVLIKNI